jgi:hypothetical protein
VGAPRTLWRAAPRRGAAATHAPATNATNFLRSVSESPLRFEKKGKKEKKKGKKKKKKMVSICLLLMALLANIAYCEHIVELPTTFSLLGVSTDGLYTGRVVKGTPDGGFKLREFVLAEPIDLLLNTQVKDTSFQLRVHILAENLLEIFLLERSPVWPLRSCNLAQNCMLLSGVGMWTDHPFFILFFVLNQI